MDNPALMSFILSALLGAAVFICVWALASQIANAFDPLRKRVLAIQQRGLQPERRNRFLLVMQQLGTRLMPRTTHQRQHAATLLRHADYRSEHAVPIFYGIKITTMALMPLFVLATTNALWGLNMDDVPLYLAVAGLVGMVAPDFVLKQQVKRRQARLQEGLPDTMDLLVVCAEAGLGLNASIHRVATEIKLTHPELAKELQLYSMQISAGMNSRESLADLKARSGVEDIQTLVTTLMQSMRFGTSIADTLRVYSSELRDKRLQAIEEKAARVATLMLIPMVTCILPSFLLVILGPPILSAMRSLSG
jgi:tight adherence protein C